MAMRPIAVLPPKGSTRLWALATAEEGVESGPVKVSWPWGYFTDRERALARARRIAGVSGQDIHELVGGRLVKLG